MASPCEQVTENIISELVKTLISIIGEKDEFLKGHSERVASTCVRFGMRLGLPKTKINQIYLAGLLHDIGMISVPREILGKTGEISKDEDECIKKHPDVSVKILSNLHMMNAVLPMVSHHHEAFDGSGYPDGLKGEELSLETRILSIINYYDKITVARNGKPSLSSQEAKEELIRSTGKMFDKELVDSFLEYIDSDSSNTSTDQKEIKNSSILSNKPPASDNKMQLQDSIAKIVKQVKSGSIDLPVLPKVIQEIQKVMNQSTANVGTLAHAVEKDAVISVKVISAANSPFYRGTEKIRSVDSAISRLGFKETQTIVNTIANKSLYNTKNSNFKILMEKLWLHSLASAYCSKIIASFLKLGDPEKYFLMGLIHDIGKTLLIKVLGDEQYQTESLGDEDILSAVQDIHTSFGGAILRRWGFSEDYIRVSLLHEGPHYNEKTDKDVLIANLANNMAYYLGYGTTDRDEIPLENLDSVRFLEMEAQSFIPIQDQAKKLMEETAHIF